MSLTGQYKISGYFISLECIVNFHVHLALNQLGTTIVVATHDLGLIAATPGSQLIRLENGNLIDPTGALRNPPAATVVA